MTHLQWNTGGGHSHNSRDKQHHSKLHFDDHASLHPHVTSTAVSTHCSLHFGQTLKPNKKCRKNHKPCTSLALIKPLLEVVSVEKHPGSFRKRPRSPVTPAGVSTCRVSPRRFQHSWVSGDPLPARRLEVCRAFWSVVRIPDIYLFGPLGHFKPDSPYQPAWSALWRAAELLKLSGIPDWLQLEHLVVCKIDLSNVFRYKDYFQAQSSRQLFEIA